MASGLESITFFKGHPAGTLPCNNFQTKVELNSLAVVAELVIPRHDLDTKNYLFAGLDAGGERAAAIYGLIASAKLNGLDPEAYLREVLKRTADHPIARISELLPGISVRLPQKCRW